MNPGSGSPGFATATVVPTRVTAMTTPRTEAIWLDTFGPAVWTTREDGGRGRHDAS
jgi:hypothetical protein